MRRLFTIGAALLAALSPHGAGRAGHEPPGCWGFTIDAIGS